jgi:hypothetical protein
LLSTNRKRLTIILFGGDLALCANQQLAADPVQFGFRASFVRSFDNLGGVGKAVQRVLPLTEHGVCIGLHRQ